MALLQKAPFIKKLAKIHAVPVSSKNAKYSTIGNIESFQFQSNFTEEEQTKILNILNDSNTHQLSRFHVSQNRIKSIDSWKNKKGSFKTLNEVLEVDGLGEKLLHKMCENIVKNDVNNTNLQINVCENIVKMKRQKQLVIPTVTGHIVNSIKSAIGLHLSPMGLSWSKLSTDQNKLISWNFESFSSLPQKMLISETFQKAVEIVHKIPPSDVYIFESYPSMGLQNQMTNSVNSSYTQQLELSSMLLSLLNTSIHHNVTLQNGNATNTTLPTLIENRVFYLKSRTSSRLFNTLVGQEKVAAISTVKKLLNKEELPCTPITIGEQLKVSFNAQSSAKKELLGQALLIVVTFMDLCIYKNPVSLDSVFNINKKPKK